MDRSIVRRYWTRFMFVCSLIKLPADVDVNH